MCEIKCVVYTILYDDTELLSPSAAKEVKMLKVFYCVTVLLNILKNTAILSQ